MLAIKSSGINYHEMTPDDIDRVNYNQKSRKQIIELKISLSQSLLIGNHACLTLVLLTYEKTYKLIIIVAEQIILESFLKKHLMKKVFTLSVAFLVIIITFTVASAQDNIVRYIPSCGGAFGKCGFVRLEGFDRKEEIIPKNYEAAIEFSDGLAGVRIKGKWGFIDIKENIVITPQFDLVGSFSHGLAEVLLDKQVGTINREGKLVIKPQFSRAIPFSENVVIAKEGDWRSGHLQGHEKLENIKDLVSFSSGLYGLYSVQNGWITKPEWEFRIFDRTGKISLIWAKHKDKQSLYGLMRPDGTWQVEPRYDHVQFLMDERAIVGKKEEIKAEQKERDRKSIQGAVDPEGRLVVPLRSWGLAYWKNGFALMNDIETQKEGLLDKAGNLVGNRFFDKVGRGINGIGEVMIDGVWHGIDKHGNIVAHPTENGVYKKCSSGLKLVFVSGKRQFMDINNKPTVPYLLDHIMQFDCDRMTAVEYKGKWGYVDRNGRLLFDPPEFDNQSEFIEGYAVVQKNKKWGIINEQGEFTVQPIYDKLQADGKNIYKVSLPEKEFWINAAGVEQPEPQQQVIDRTSYLSCSEGLKIIPNNSKWPLWGIADTAGKIIIKPQYRAIHCFQNGVAWVPNDAKRQWCPIDPNGVLQDYPKCVTSRYPYIQTLSIPKNFSHDPYENSVLWSRAFLEFGLGLRKEHPRMNGDK